MIFDNIENIEATYKSIDEADAPEINAGNPRQIAKKRYTRSMLTRHGKVSRLAAGLTGSNTDGFGGDQTG